jgi:hypothetical protein
MSGREDRLNLIQENSSRMEQLFSWSTTPPKIIAILLRLPWQHRTIEAITVTYLKQQNVMALGNMGGQMGRGTKQLLLGP